ncbi:MAG: YeeE/YedE thiosulfate transporter family protein [Caulobacteraceae bacterium]
MNTLTQRGLGLDERSIGSAAARPFWNPYLAGVLLGLVLLATYVVTGRGLGATAGFAAVATWLAGLVSPAHIQASVVHLKYWNEGAPLLNWTLFVLIGALVGAAISGWQAHRFSFTIERGPRVTDGQRLALAFVGGFIAACGAKLAKGCTSGQALTGSSILNVGSLVFLLAVFAAAFGLAYFVRKEWL